MNISQDRQVFVFSSGILRLVGYGLLIMALVDFIFLLIPLKLMNPVWEFQTIGAIIERIPITLLGMVFVYYGERDDRAPIERFILRWLSRLSLVFSVLLLLMIPLSVTSSFRIYYQHNAQINARVVSQIDVIQDFQEKFKTANTSQQISAILAEQTQQPIDIPKSTNPQKLKTDIVNSLQKNENELRNRAKSLRSAKQAMLLKNCIKWNLGALIAACLFFCIWKTTFWARLEVDLED